MENALNSIYMSARNVYKVDVPTAMSWLKRATNDLPCDVIKSGSHHAKLLSYEANKKIDCNEQSVLQDLEKTIVQLLPSQNIFSVFYLLNFEEYDVFYMVNEVSAVVKEGATLSEEPKENEVVSLSQ